MKDMTTAEILAEYNKLTGKNVKKFTDRKAAERRLKAARIVSESSVTTSKSKVAAKGKKKKPHKTNVTQHIRHRVSVQKGKTKAKEYRSVKQAFEELGLPLGVHIKFRMALKAKGSHEINGYKFKLVR